MKQNSFVLRRRKEEGGEADRSPSMLLTTYYSPSLRTSQSGLVSGLCCSLNPSPWLSAVTPLKRVLALGLRAMIPESPMSLHMFEMDIAGEENDHLLLTLRMDVQ